MGNLGGIRDILCQVAGGGERDGGGLGAHQVVMHQQLLGDQGTTRAGGEAVRPAVPRGAGEAFQASRSSSASWAWVGQRESSLSVVALPRSSPAMRRAGRERCHQVGTQPVQQPPLVAGGAFVVAGDGTQLPGQLPVRDESAQVQERVQS